MLLLAFFYQNGLIYGVRMFYEIEAAPLGQPPIVRDLIKGVNQKNVVVERRKLLKDVEVFVTYDGVNL